MKKYFSLLYSFFLVTIFAQQIFAQTPKVTTDTRFARGATMVFGRIKGNPTANGGSAIVQKGLCIAEKSNPTVNDIVSTKQLINSGIIYYFENLKPGTKYYMRAYATNKDGVTGYGDAITIYTIPKGTVTYSYNNGGSSDQNKRINDALTQACDIFCNLTSIKKHFSIGFSAGTQTADCNYSDSPWMNVGPNTSYQRTGTIMHEMQHGLGVIPYSTQWSGDILRSGNGTGEWLGDRVSAFLDFWDNTTGSRLKGDTQHMWPYGINGAQEDNGTLLLYYGNAMIGQALGEDGLEHSYSSYATPYYSFNHKDNVKYYIKNESQNRGLYTSFLKSNSTGALRWEKMSAEDAVSDDYAAWYITFNPSNQYYQLRNVATGQYLTYNGEIKTTTKQNLTSSEDWHLMKGRVDVDGQRGYWIIHPESNWQPHCLQANDNGNTASTVLNISNNAVEQRWLIITLENVTPNEITAMNKMRQLVEESLLQVKTLAAVPHKEVIAGADQALQAVINDVETNMTKAKTPVELESLSDEVLSAADVFLNSVVVTDVNKPFDLTYKLMNQTIDDNTDGWSVATTVGYGCGEFYEKSFDFNQTVKGLPAGTYAFCANAFQRPGTKDKAASVAVNAQIYAGNKSEKLAHITADAQSKKVGKGREVAYNSKYAPDDMQAASAYFALGCYNNIVYGSVNSSGGSLKVGITCSSVSSGYWVIFDNFRLYYYGNISIDDLSMQETNTDNIYKLTYVIDDAVYKTVSYKYGAPIQPESPPLKDGYEFSGWDDVPSLMPAYNVLIKGYFTKISYKLTYMLDGTIYKIENYNIGATVNPEPAPVKDGYTFSGWISVPTTMPENDVIVTGTFSKNSYKLTYMVDGQVYKTFNYEYGAAIAIVAAPTKEGYTFSGWSDTFLTMPAKDVIITGSFIKTTPTIYKLTYMVDGELYSTFSYDYGTAITPLAAPTKDGCTFSGWSTIPATMPNYDVTITGSFTKDKYTLTYMVNGVVYKTISYDYGEKITPEPEPTRDGATFSGWSWIPSKMPEEDVIVTGTFDVEMFKLTYKVDGEEYKTIELEAGAKITPEPAPTKEGYDFSGWSWIPSKMPDEDVTITGTFTPTTGVEAVISNSKLFDVYSTTGVLLRRQVTTLKGLPAGFYIVNGKKVHMKAQ